MKYIADRALVFTPSGAKHSIVFTEKTEFDDVEAFRKEVAGSVKEIYGVEIAKINLTYEEKGE